MPRGWETWLRIRGQKDGYGGGASVTDAFYPFLDSESLAINQEIKENNAKIVQGRAVLETARTLQGQEPGGQFTFQPRADDVLGVLASVMGCYKSVDGGGTASGTYTFWPLTGQPDFSGTLLTGGDPWNAGGKGTGTYGDTPTDVCALMVDQYFGDITGTNGRRFVDCIVSQLEFNAAVGNELTVTPTINAGSYALFNGTSATDDPPCGVGSYSALDAFRYYQGTVTVDGDSYDLNSFRLTVNNNVDSKKAIGQQTPVAYPYGRCEITGEFELEYDNSTFMEKFSDESDGTLGLVFLNGADKLTITCPLIRYDEPTVNVGDGEGLVNQTVSFKAFGRTANRLAPPIEVEVACSNLLVGGTTFFPL